MSRLGLILLTIIVTIPKTLLRVIPTTVIGTQKSICSMNDKFQKRKTHTQKKSEESVIFTE